MFDEEKISAVMIRTGADAEMARAALDTSDGNVDIAVRIIQSYILKTGTGPDTGTAGAAGAAGSAGSTAPGEGFAEAAGPDTAGAPTGEPGSAASEEQAEEKQSENRFPNAQDIIDAIKDIWKKGNASRLDIEKGGHVILSISLTVGTIGLVIAPVAALIGLGAALVTQYTIKITLDNGTVINVNEFAVTHRHTQEPKEPRD